MTEMSVGVTVEVDPELQRQMNTTVWQLLLKEADGAQQLSLAIYDHCTIVSIQTVYRWFIHIGLYAYKLTRCVPLMVTDCVASG
ncbi:hypothetical protein TNCV_2941501 [Trichonephila clavipes]|nr:hypothetical protein TNCV_2941501 [Trichonephila clavipes]